MIGAAVAVGAIVVVSTSVMLDGRLLPRDSAHVSRVLVVCTVSDESGGERAPVAFVLDTQSRRATPVDTLSEVIVAGTSARTARDAYPFGGGEVVAKAVAPQVDGEVLPWLVLKEDVWSGMGDRAGGVAVNVPTSLSVYVGGKLTLIPSGRRTLTGAEMVGLATALAYLGDPAVRREVAKELAVGVSSVVSAEAEQLPELVRTGRVSSSVEPEAIESLEFGR